MPTQSFLNASLVYNMLDMETISLFLEKKKQIKSSSHFWGVGLNGYFNVCDKFTYESTIDASVGVCHGQGQRLSFIDGKDKGTRPAEGALM